MASIEDQLGDWYGLLKGEFRKQYMVDLQRRLTEDRRKLNVWPEKENVFRALQLCPPSFTKVVILGQDPYHTRNVANGLSFSTNASDGYIPPSLDNIFREIEKDLDVFEIAHNPDLARWATQGVLLLNTCLTVIQGAPASHSNIGWLYFTKRIIKILAERADPCSFILWGRYAQRVAAPYMEDRHGVIRSPHPSPHSARKGFYGSKPFSRTNIWLEKQGREPIDWIRYE